MKMNLSVYNHFVTLEDGSLLGFNHRTTLMARFDAQTHRQYLDPQDGDPNRAGPELLTELTHGGFVVPAGFDEQASVLQAADARQAGMDARLTVAVATTFGCNFRCTYCYEARNRRHERMTLETARQLVSFVAERFHPGTKSLQVLWFGGEPMLEMDTIVWLTERFMRLCEERRAKYEASLCSNGYLLEPERIPLIKKLGITRIQVTLDGLGAAHDRRRPHASGCGTFTRLVENLKGLAGQFRLSIRLSVDQGNVGDIPATYAWLGEQGLLDQAHVYAARIDASIAAPHPSLAESCFSIEEYCATLLGKFQSDWLGMRLATPYPALWYGLCLATNPNGYVVEPSGELQRCLLHVGDSSQVAGDLWSGQDDGRAGRWFDLNPMQRAECRRCSFLPHCFGGCRYGWLTAGRPTCTPLRRGFDDWLKLRYRRRRLMEA